MHKRAREFMIAYFNSQIIVVMQFELCPMPGGHLQWAAKEILPGSGEERIRALSCFRSLAAQLIGSAHKASGIF